MAKTPEELVADFVDGEARIEAYFALAELGSEALPAIREGLKHGHWQVRRWCTMLLDHLADPEALHDLVPLLRDPKANVRLWAVHSISCDRCKTGENPIDVAPLLIERIELDDSIKVRRMATAMLAGQCEPDARVVPVLERILTEEDDRKLKLHARRALERHAAVGPT